MEREVQDEAWWMSKKCPELGWGNGTLLNCFGSDCAFWQETFVVKEVDKADVKRGRCTR